MPSIASRDSLTHLAGLPWINCHRDFSVETRDTSSCLGPRTRIRTSKRVHLPGRSLRNACRLIVHISELIDILFPGNFVVNERDSAVRLSCLGTIRHARDDWGNLHIRVLANSCGSLPVRSLARSLARSPDSCRLFPVSLHGERVHG